MIYPDSTEHAALISGLRGLADYLESTRKYRPPAIPPCTCPGERRPGGNARRNRRHRRGELDVIARETPGGHYIATRSFGPVEYRAVAIPRSKESDATRASKANVPSSRFGWRGDHGRFGGRDPRGPDHRNPPG